MTLGNFKGPENPPPNGEKWNEYDIDMKSHENFLGLCVKLYPSLSIELPETNYFQERNLNGKTEVMVLIWRSKNRIWMDKKSRLLTSADDLSTWGTCDEFLISFWSFEYRKYLNRMFGKNGKSVIWKHLLWYEFSAVIKMVNMHEITLFFSADLSVVQLTMKLWHN